VALSRPRTLVLRALGLGDFLTGMPALRAVRRARPDDELVLAAPAVLTPLVRLSGTADRLLDTAGLGPVSWTGAPPELAVNLHGRGPQSHRLLQRLRPGALVAFGSEEAGHRGPTWTADEHEVARWCRLVECQLGAEREPADLALPPPAAPSPAPGAVVVHPGAAFEARRWPAERFAAVARWAADQGHDVVVSGGPDEVRLAQRVARAARLPDDRVLAGRTDLEGIASLVASAALLVCGDTGVAHLATAFSVPSVLLFGPTPPARWGPPAEGPHAVLWHGTGTGDPWGTEADSSLLEIGVDEVTGAMQRLLRGSVRSERARRTTPASA
jgi:ADP-heptose:LPS heptosyltransferase